MKADPAAHRQLLIEDLSYERVREAVMVESRGLNQQTSPDRDVQDVDHQVNVTAEHRRHDRDVELEPEHAGDAERLVRLVAQRRQSAPDDLTAALRHAEI